MKDNDFLNKPEELDVEMMKKLFGGDGNDPPSDPPPDPPPPDDPDKNG